MGSLINGASVTLELRATVAAGAGGTTIANNATVTSADQADHTSANDTAGQSISVPLADLGLAMSVDIGTPNVGEVVAFTITLTNHGPNAASGVVVTDLLPAGLTYSSSTPSQGNYVGGSGVWTVGSVANGATATLILRATVVAGAAGNTIANNASITTADQADHVAANDTAGQSVTVQAADLGLVMNVDNATPDEGNTVAFTITLTNNGPNAATGVVVTDVLQTGLTYVSSTPSQGSYTSGTGAWTVGTLASGASVTLVVRAAVNPGTGGSSLSNNASITAANQGDPVTANNSATQTVQVTLANLGLAMVVDNAAPNEGTQVSFTLTLTNTGPTFATGIVVTDLLPAGLTYVPSTPSQGTYNSGSGTWSVGGLANGASAIFVLRATVDAGTGGTSIINNAMISAANQADPVATNNSASRTLSIPLADLGIGMTVNNSTPDEDKDVNFTLTVTNHGPNAATNVVVTDLLPAGLTYRSSTPGQGTYSSTTGIWNVGSLAAGATATFVLKAKTQNGTAGMTIVNSATITGSDQADYVATNSSASVSITVELVDIALGMTVSNPAPNEGADVVFTITATNLGPAKASGVKVTDLLPAAGLTFVSFSSTHGNYTSGSGVWSVGDLDNGETHTATLTARVKTGAGGTAFTNFARVTDVHEVDSQAANDSAGKVLTIPLADLAVAISLDEPAPNEGEVVTYTVTLTNNGPDPATTVRVTDLLPAGLTLQTATPVQGSYASGTGVWTVGSLANGASTTLTLVAAVNTGTGGTTKINTATIMPADQADHTATNNSASQSLTVQLANLGVAMTVDNVAPNDGDVVTYTVTLTNLGPHAATGIAVTDLLPATLTYQSSTPSQGTYLNGTGVWAVGGLANGASATMALAATINSGGATVINTASITAADQADHVTANNTASRAVAGQLADLGVALNANQTSVNEGDPVTFTVTVTNLGPTAASGVTVAAGLANGLTLETSTPSQGTYSSGSGAWAVGNLAVSASATLTLTTTVDAGTGGTSIVTDASVSASDQPDPNNANDAANRTVAVPLADLELIMDVDEQAPNEGATVAFAFKVTNNGPDPATSVTVTDLLPAGLAYVSSTPSQGTYVSGTGVWTVGGIANGSNATLTLRAQVTAGAGGTSIANQARVGATQADHDTTNNSASQALAVPLADLAVELSLDNPAPNEGDTLTYLITLANNGPDAATGVQVRDALPVGLSLLSATPSQGSYTSGVWTVGGLASAGTATLALTATVDPGTGGATLADSAGVSSTDQADHDTANNVATQSLTVQSADLGIAVAVDDATPNVATLVAFTVTVTNHGPDAASGIVVQDLLPSGLTFVISAPSQGTYDAGSGFWTLGDLANGASANLVITATVDLGTGGTTLTDSARVVAADQADPVASNDAADRTVTVPLADLGLEVTADALRPNEGESVTFTVTITNHGPDAATGVTVNNSLSAGLTLQSTTPSQGSFSAGSWTVGGLANGASATLQIQATVNAGVGGTSIADAALISAAAEADPVPANNIASIGVSVPLSDLEVLLSVDDPAANEGQLVTFTLTLKNHGVDDATGIAVTEALPTGFAFVSAIRPASAGREVKASAAIPAELRAPVAAPSAAARTSVAPRRVTADQPRSARASAPLSRSSPASCPDTRPTNSSLVPVPVVVAWSSSSPGPPPVSRLRATAESGSTSSSAVAGWPRTSRTFSNIRSPFPISRDLPPYRIPISRRCPAASSRCRPAAPRGSRTPTRRPRRGVRRSRSRRCGRRSSARPPRGRRSRPTPSRRS